MFKMKFVLAILLIGNAFKVFSSDIARHQLQSGMPKLEYDELVRVQRISKNRYAYWSDGEQSEIIGLLSKAKCCPIYIEADASIIYSCATSLIIKYNREGISFLTEEKNKLSEYMLVKSEMARDASFQKFRSLFTAYFNFLNNILKTVYDIHHSPYDTQLEIESFVFTWAANKGLLLSPDFWVACKTHSNNTSNPNSQVAQEIYDFIPQFIKAFEEGIENLKQVVG